MSWIMVDVEADGPVPGLYSLIQIGAIVVREPLEEAPTFFGQMRPVGGFHQNEALAIFGMTHAETLKLPDPVHTMNQFDLWIKEHGGKRPMFISDNNGFDFMFVSYYFWRMIGRNPFGHSSMNLGSLYKGLVGDTFQSFKHLRHPIPHDHNPVNDAKGNALALIKMKKEMGLKIKLK